MIIHVVLNEEKFHVRIKNSTRVVFLCQMKTANDSWLAESNDQLA